MSTPTREPPHRAAPPDDPGSRDARLALLARTIEHEIIPRLMLAHEHATARNTQDQDLGRPIAEAELARFLDLIIQGGCGPDEDAAHAFLGRLRADGVSVQRLFIDLLAPTAQRLGEMWEHDKASFTDVTLGVGRLQQLLREFSPTFSQQGEQPSNGLRILLVAAPGEQHTFGLAVVSEFFRHEGWDVCGGPVETGADPADMAATEWFDVIGFSMAADQHATTLARCVRAVRAASVNPGVGIMVGGPAFMARPELAAQVQADFVTGDARQAPAQALQFMAKRMRPA